MNIKEEKIDELNSLLTIELKEDDYSKQYNAALKDYRKKVNLPGFRAGMVPVGIVKKRFGKSLLADELNKILNESLQNYITENKVQVLGNPIPSEQHEDQGDWDNPEDFKFVYELGLAPEFELNISDKDKFTYHIIDVEKDVLDKQIGDIAKRYGKLSEIEISDRKDLLIGELIQLDENDEILAGGIMNEATISIEFVSDDKTVEKLTGLKVGDEVTVDPNQISSGHDDLAKMLGISHEEVHHLTGNFKFRVKEIKRLQPAEVNQELFDKIFGEGTVSDEKEFRAKMADDLRKMFSADSDRMFKRDVTKILIEKLDLTLPDEFLKRWIRMTNEKPISSEEIENEYPEYKRSLEWQLIFNKLVSENGLEVKEEEVVARTQSLLSEQYAQYGIPAPEEKELEDSARKVLANQDEARKVFDMLYDEKLIEFLKEKAAVEEKVVDYDTFVKLAQQA